MSRDLLLALDLGTSGVRALAVAPDGSVPARAYRPLATSFPRPGWVEQDPGQLFESSLEVLRRVVAECGGVRECAGIGVATQRATVLAWDARTGAPLAPAISWQDTRTAERVSAIRAAGLPISTAASAPKLGWWLENDETIRKAAAAGTLRFGTPDCWLTSCLTGREAHVTDPGQASCTALFDPNAGAFAEPLCDLFGVPIEPLPEVVPTSAIVAETPAALLGASLPVAARAGDQQAAAFGQGVHAAGEAKLTLGTSAMVDAHTGSEIAPAPPATFPLALWKLAPDDPIAFCLEGQVLTAGAAVDWLVALGVAEHASALDRLAGEIRSSDGVTFVPALQGLGTPYGDETARGLLAGLTRGSGRAQLARAVLEGIAQRCADVVDALALTGTPLRVDGGLARSDFLLQEIADATGSELLRAAEAEATALGAAFLAGLGLDVFTAPADCRRVLGEPSPFVPAIDSEKREQKRALWSRILERARELG